MKSSLRRIAIVVLSLAAMLYIGDDLSLRYRIYKNHDAFGTVIVKPYYAIHEKNGKIEYDFAPPQAQTCARSLLPHYGFPPCWYAAQHTEKKINI